MSTFVAAFIAVWPVLLFMAWLLAFALLAEDVAEAAS